MANLNLAVLALTSGRKDLNDTEMAFAYNAIQQNDSTVYSGVLLLLTTLYLMKSYKENVKIFWPLTQSEKKKHHKK